MDQPEYFGEDKDEDLLGALAKITYHLRRDRGEGHRSFFARWEECLRKIQEHNVMLPDKYQGFLMINALGLSDADIKALMNFTRGSIATRDVKDWVRKHETKLQIKEVGIEKEKPKAKTSAINYVAVEEDEEEEQEVEILQAALEDLQPEGEHAENQNGDGEEIYYDEHEAAEILSTMLHQKKRTFTQSLKLKKAKELGRGFNKGFGKGKKGHNMGKQTVEQLKQVTRCGNCLKVGHWHKECPEPPRRNGKGSASAHGAKETMFIEVDKGGDHEAFFCGHLQAEKIEKQKDEIARDQEVTNALPKPSPGKSFGKDSKPGVLAGSKTPHAAPDVLSPIGHEPGSEEFLMAEDSPTVVHMVGSETETPSQSDRAYKVHSMNEDFYHDCLCMRDGLKVDVTGVDCIGSEFHEICYVSPENSKRSTQPTGQVNEACCATIDTGCQRMAIGEATLERLVRQLPDQLEVDMIKQEHKFRSVHGTSKTDQVASVPTSLGKKGCFLRPAVFSNEASREAPFLISLPFLLHCRTVLYLDAERGLRLFFRRFGFGVDCHLGPTGALRVPLDQFQPEQLRTLQKAQHDMRSTKNQEFEVFKTCRVAGSDCDKLEPQSKSTADCHEKIPHGREVPSELAEDDRETGLRHVQDQRVSPQGTTSQGARDGRDELGRGKHDQQPGRAMEPCVRRRTTGKWLQATGTGRDSSHDGRPLLSLRADDQEDGTTTTLRARREMHGVDHQEAGPQLSSNLLAMPHAEISAMRHVPMDGVPALLAGQSDGNLVPWGTRCGKSHAHDVALTDRANEVPVNTTEDESDHSIRGDQCSATGSTGQEKVDQQESGRVSAQGDHNSGQQRLCEASHLQAVRQGDREDPIEVSGQESELFNLSGRETPNQEGGDQARDGDRRLPGVPSIPEVEKGQGAGSASQPSRELEVLPSAVASESEKPNRRQRRTLSQIQKKGQVAIERVETMLQEIMSLLSTESSESLAVEDINAAGKRKRNWKTLGRISKMGDKDLRRVAEVFNPGKFIQNATQHELLPGEAFDLELGDDLLQEETQLFVRDYVQNVRPGLVVISPPCTLFSILQNLNLERLRDPQKHKEFLRELLKAKRLLKFAVEIVNIVRSYSGTFLLEHPLTSRAWQEKMVQDLLMEEDVLMAKGDQCAFGLQDTMGHRMRKRTGWVTNNQQIYETLNRSCDGQHEHVPVLGQTNGENRSRQAQRYPLALINAVLHAYKRSIEGTVEINWMQMEDIQRQLARNHRLKSMMQEEDSAEIMAVNEVMRDKLKDLDPEEEQRHEILAADTERGDEPEGVAPDQPEEIRPVAPEEPHREEDAEIPGEPERPERLLPRERPFSTEQLVRRAHEGLGHPGNEKLARIWKGAGASDKAIQIAKKIECAVCHRHQQVRPPRAAAPPKELPVNHTIGVDTVWLPTHRGKQKMALNVVCWSSRFQMITPLANHTPAEARRAYLQWVKFFGPPQRLYTDLGKEFRAAFQEGAELDSTFIDPGALEMPTQRSITERAGKTFKLIFEKALDGHTCQNEEEWRDLVDITAMTVNRLVNKSGYSPIQRVLGYSPRVPGSEFLGGHHDHAVRSWAYRGDLQVQRAQTMRLAAAKAFHEADGQQAIKNSLHAGHRSIEEFEVGNTVYFWRKAQGGKIAKNTARHWRGPAKVILTSPPNAIWITFRGHVVKAAPEHLRLASSEEHSSLTAWMDDLASLRHELEKEPTAGYIDLTKENGDSLPQDVDLDGLEPGPTVVPKFRLTNKTQHQQVIPREQTDYWQQMDNGILRRVHMEEREYNYSPVEGDCPVAVDRLDDWRRTKRRFSLTGEEEVQDDDWRNHPEDHRKEPWKGYTDFRVHETSTSSSPATTRPVAIREEPEELVEDKNNKRSLEQSETMESEKRTKVTENQPLREETEEEMRRKLRSREGPEGEEEESRKKARVEWNEIFYQGALTALAMKQKKEIKYKDLIGIVKEKFDNAIKKEINNNLQTGAYEILSPEESEKVRRQEDANILQSRYVFVEKMIDAEEIEDARRGRESGVQSKGPTCHERLQWTGLWMAGCSDTSSSSGDSDAHPTDVEFLELDTGIFGFYSSLPLRQRDPKDSICWTTPWRSTWTTTTAIVATPKTLLWFAGRTLSVVSTPERNPMWSAWIWTKHGGPMFVHALWQPAGPHPAELQRVAREKADWHHRSCNGWSTTWWRRTTLGKDEVDPEQIQIREVLRRGWKIRRQGDPTVGEPCLQGPPTTIYQGQSCPDRADQTEKEPEVWFVHRVGDFSPPRTTWNLVMVGKRNSSWSSRASLLTTADHAESNDPTYSGGEQLGQRSKEGDGRGNHHSTNSAISIEDWSGIRCFLGKLTGELCGTGEPGLLGRTRRSLDPSPCFTEEDPIPQWISSWRIFTTWLNFPEDNSGWHWRGGHWRFLAPEGRLQRSRWKELEGIYDLLQKARPGEPCDQWELLTSRKS